MSIAANLDLRRVVVGERDFRDFSRLPPMKENRIQSADPTRAIPMASGQEGFYVKHDGRLDQK